MHPTGVFLVCFLILGASLAQQQQDNIQTRIPDSLIECYKNVTLNHREFRPPFTINTFIELVRKIEQYPGSNMDMRALTVTLLQRFRLDGIEQNTEVMISNGVIPFAVKGYQFFKHRILMRTFLPGSPERFQNESLSITEQCTMHFMLSNSIDKGKRGDEGSVCNQIQNYRSRPPRSIAADVKAVKDPTPDDDVVDIMKLVAKTVAPDSQPNMDVELINVQNLSNPSAEKGNMFVDDDADRRRPTSKPRPIPRRNQDAAAFNPRATQADYSECPVENGAVYTPSGTLTLGTLLAGIAAGLQPLTVPSQQLNPKIQSSVQVENLWAATLAGDLAELVLLQGPKYSSNMKLGPSGGWNSTILPRWYFIKEVLDNQMTDSEIRGGLDGLIIGKNIDEWNRKVGNRLKLSQVLDMYYSDRGVFGDTQFRACARKDRFSDVTTRETMEEQTDGFATILDPQMINEAYLDEDKIMELSREASNRLTNYIPSNLDSVNCNSQGRADSTVNSVSAVELYIVLDTSWQFADMRPLLMAMMTKLEMGMYGSNLTVIAGKEMRTILNGTSSIIDFTTNFTEAVYSQITYGMDLPGALKWLSPIFRYQLQSEKQSNTAGSTSKVVVFIPPTGHTMNEDDKKYARDQVQYFHEKIPDVKFIYFTQGNKERYQDLVDDPSKDIFELRIGSDAASIDATLDPIVSRLKQVHHRIINPVCGVAWVTQSYSNAQYTAFIEPSKVVYYRLHPNYFYAAGWGKIKVQGFNYGNLKVCYSRRNEYPGNSTGSGSDTTCKQINQDTLDISFDKPCDGYDFVSQCPPYYISVEATAAGTPQCFENGCRFPDSVKYTVINEGLTCTGGIGRFLGSPSLIALFALMSITLSKTYK